MVKSERYFQNVYTYTITFPILLLFPGASLEVSSFTESRSAAAAAAASLISKKKKVRYNCQYFKFAMFVVNKSIPSFRDTLHFPLLLPPPSLYLYPKVSRSLT